MEFMTYTNVPAKILTPEQHQYVVNGVMSIEEFWIDFLGEAKVKDIVVQFVDCSSKLTVTQFIATKLAAILKEEDWYKHQHN